MIIQGNNEALNNAAIWLRQELNIHPNQTIFAEFEEYFNCKITVRDRTDPWYMPSLVEFANENDAMMFLLRWS
jgi:hypothetical protein